MKKCFVISPIGDETSDIRSRSDEILQYIITPVFSNRGYEVTRADKIDEPGIITTQIIQRIIDDDIVIADLTGHNPNVFYELAIRHSIKKPFIQIIKEGEKIPFDIAGVRTISIDEHNLSSAEAAKKSINKSIDSIESEGYKVESPVTIAVDIQSLRQSENPERRSLAEVLSAFSDLRSDISNMNEIINSMHNMALRESNQRRVEKNRESTVSRRSPTSFAYREPDKLSALQTIDNKISMIEMLSKEDDPEKYIATLIELKKMREDLIKTIK